ncbi:MAG: YggT family protein [Clostridia bacterium]|nr:YggT family protein [Clostridia bacterium]
MGVLNVILYCLCNTLRLAVGLAETLIVLRALLSWFPIDEESLIPRLLYALTEPIIMPVRAILSRFGMDGDSSLIDFSPLITMLLLMFIGMFLPEITL